MRTFGRKIIVAILAGVLTVAPIATHAGEQGGSQSGYSSRDHGDYGGYEDGDDAAMILDFVMLRPAGLVSLVGGVAVYVVSLPFQLTSWNFRDPWESLVERPFEYTFLRDLGDETW